MNNFKNLKIAITDETHLKAVCDVLESMGYELDKEHCGLGDAAVGAWDDGAYCTYKHIGSILIEDASTLSDLLKMRDDMVKANAKSR